jgi:hypothetical protein
MGVQQQQAGNNGEYCITEQVDGMSHFFTIALDHRLQFFDILRCDLSLDKAIQAINNRQHPDNKIETDIHNPAILTQLKAEQYKESKMVSVG